MRPQWRLRRASPLCHRNRLMQLVAYRISQPRPHDRRRWNFAADGLLELARQVRDRAVLERFAVLAQLLGYSPCQLSRDHPVGTRLAGRWDGAVEPLDSAFEIGERALALDVAAGREEH